MKKTIFFLALASFIFWAGFSHIALGQIKDPDYLFKKAGSYYEAGDYSEAIKTYNMILSQGIESGNLYYNLGNCYFKKGQLGKAILNYERASLLIPLDSDLKANYEYTKSLLKVSPVLTVSKAWFARVLDKISKSLGINGLSVLLSILWIVICGSLLVCIFSPIFKKVSYYFVPLLAIAFVFFVFSLKIMVTRIDKQALVIEEAEARFEPLEKATVFFTLPTASKIEVLESKDNWSKVKRGDGKIGWIKSGLLELLSTR